MMRKETAKSNGFETRSCEDPRRGPVAAAGVQRDLLNGLALVSHELRNALTAIVGYADLLEQTAGTMAKEQRQTVGWLNRCARDLLQLLDSAFELSCTEIKLARSERALVDIGELLTELAADVALHSDGARVVWQVAPSVPRLSASAVKLKMVLRNLIVNALKYSPNGAITVTAAECGTEVEIAVADQGSGISATARELVFRPYYQCSAGTGAGLGLYVARRLTEWMGGRIAVEAPPEGGCRFAVRLPRPSEACADRAHHQQ